LSNDSLETMNFMGTCLVCVNINRSPLAKK
jgi:hypothetical protein